MKTIVSHSNIFLAGLVIALCGAQRAHAQIGMPVVTDTAVVTTTAGTFTMVLYGQDAPRTVENFIKLAQKGAYQGILFHRVVPGFVVQAGDPKTRDAALRAQWGTGGESSFGAPFEDELNPNSPSYKRGYVEGTVAMANRGPNTNTSQFFVTLGNLNDKLKRHYTIFGSVIAGMDIVHVIEAGPLLDKKSGMPAQPVKILSVKVMRAKR